MVNELIESYSSIFDEALEDSYNKINRSRDHKYVKSKFKRHGFSKEINVDNVSLDSFFHNDEKAIPTILNESNVEKARIITDIIQNRLYDLESKIIGLSFFHKKSLSEISFILDLSERKIRYYKNCAIKKIKAILDDRPIKKSRNCLSSFKLKNKDEKLRIKWSIRPKDNCMALLTKQEARKKYNIRRINCARLTPVSRIKMGRFWRYQYNEDDIVQQLRSKGKIMDKQIDNLSIDELTELLEKKKGKQEVEERQFENDEDLVSRRTISHKINPGQIYKKIAEDHKKKAITENEIADEAEDLVNIMAEEKEFESLEHEDVNPRTQANARQTAKLGIKLAIKYFIKSLGHRPRLTAGSWTESLLAMADHLIRYERHNFE